MQRLLPFLPRHNLDSSQSRLRNEAKSKQQYLHGADVVQDSVSEAIVACHPYDLVRVLEYGAGENPFQHLGP